ncbi:MAG: DNA-binding transcriptional regulator, partial [Verrucomicrobiae bacterium]|nr:DNA-binding transcriptional regulator [Verrucomicrobiae bacterium]
FPLGIAFMERLLQGILDYAREHGGWVFTRMPERLNPSIDWLAHWQGDGAFAVITTAADAKVARTLRMPVVNLTAYLAEPGVPTVMVDHEATGKLAARHLIERRFQRFGYYGTRGVRYSELRRAGFAAAVAKAGGRCSVLEVPATLSVRQRWNRQEEDLARWLRMLQPPVGVMASTDLRASMIADACARLGLRVPEDVAVIGVDNDPVVCEFSHPPLSSVSRNDVEVGRRAAALLDRLMRGASPPKQPILIAPDGVVARRSTQTLAIEDPHVAAAVRHIREHLHEPFGVERILDLSPVSRRRLEHRFRQSLGCTPYAFITRLRVERAKELLATPEKRTLTEIATACGFSEPRRFRLVFQRLTGATPAEYRRTTAGDAR